MKGWDWVMFGSSAVIFIPDDTGKTGGRQPLMLSPIMGTPLLTWTVSSLVARGVGRFFLVCNQKYGEKASQSFPDEVELICSHDQDAPDQLHVFLSTADDPSRPVVVLTAPTVLVDEATTVPAHLAAPSGLHTLDGEALMMALDDQAVFLDFLHARGQVVTGRQGAFGIKSLEDLPKWQPILNVQHLHRLAKGGVQIWDYAATYVEPTVCVGSGTTLLPGTILRGATCIGKDCTLGPNAVLEQTMVGQNCTVTNSHVTNATLGDGAQVGPYSHVSDVTVDCNQIVPSFSHLGGQDTAKSQISHEDVTRRGLLRGKK